VEPSVAVIENLSHDGRGIAHIDGKITFIQNALPGEEVTFKYTAQHRSYDEAYAFKVENRSKWREKPPCPHYHVCGGCSMQHIRSDAQIEHKEKVLLDQLKHFGNVIPKEVLSPLTGPTTGYRQRARLGIRYVPKKENSVLVGFREKNGQFIAEMDSCETLNPRIGLKIRAFRSFFDTLMMREFIPQMEIACTEDKVALVLRHLSNFPPEDAEKLMAFAKENDFELYFQSGGPDTVKKVWPQDDVNWMKYELSDHEVELEFHPMDFTQVNPYINRQMVNRAIALLDPQPHDNILDLFCGLGNFTIPIAQYCKKITGVEVDEAMVHRGYHNAEHNKIKNIEFHAADLAKDISNMAFAKQKYDKILLDPPRTGALELMPYFKAFNAPRVVYVSCNPATLARDVGELVQQGYILEKVGIMDMFPHTSHVESIALLTKPY
jgi:23S rRNA (uracil1939-C5)-methyltransferase